MGQTDGVCPQLLDQPGIIVMLLPGEGIALVHLILMAAHAPQRRPCAIDAEALLRIAGEAPHPCPHRHLVIGFIASLQSGRHRVQAGIVDIPFLRIRHIDSHPGLVRRPHRGSHLFPVLILNGIQHREVLVSIRHPGDQLKGSSAVLAGLGRHLQAGASIIIQVEMGIRHADQVHPSVQSAVKGEVRRLRVDAALVLVAAGHYQEILPLLFAQICHIRPERGIASLMVGDLLTVHVHGGLLPCRQNLHIDPAAAQGLPGGLEAFRVPASAPIIRPVSVMAVHRVPGMGEIHCRPLQGQCLRQARILPNEPPSLIQIDYFPHNAPPEFILFYMQSLASACLNSTPAQIPARSNSLRCPDRHKPCRSHPSSHPAYTDPCHTRARHWG